MQKIEKFKVKWTLKDKTYNNHIYIYIYMKKFNSSFDDVFFNFYFHITLMYFLSPHFSFSLCDKLNVVMSKVHYESIIFLEFTQIFYDYSH